MFILQTSYDHSKEHTANTNFDELSALPFVRLSVFIKILFFCYVVSEFVHNFAFMGHMSFLSICNILVLRPFPKFPPSLKELRGARTTQL